MNDREQAKALLEKARDYANDKNISKMLKRASTEARAYQWIMRDMYSCIDQAIALLTDCPTCGGSGSAKPVMVGGVEYYPPCPKCTDHIVTHNKKVEKPESEFVKELRHMLQRPTDFHKDDWVGDVTQMGLQLCDRIEELEKGNKTVEEANIVIANGKARISLENEQLRDKYREQTKQIAELKAELEAAETERDEYKADNEMIMDDFFKTIESAWPEKKKLFYGSSPFELVTELIEERDEFERVLKENRL